MSTPNKKQKTVRATIDKLQQNPNKTKADLLTISILKQKANEHPYR